MFYAELDLSCFERRTDQSANGAEYDGQEYTTKVACGSISLWTLSVLCVSVVSFGRKSSTTETQRTLRVHREEGLITSCAKPDAGLLLSDNYVSGSLAGNYFPAVR